MWALLRHDVPDVAHGSFADGCGGSARVEAQGCNFVRGADVIHVVVVVIVVPTHQAVGALGGGVKNEVERRTRRKGFQVLP